MAKIPTNALISSSPIPQKDLDEKVSKLISDETKKKVNEAEAIIAKSERVKEVLTGIKSEIELSNQVIGSLTNQKNGLQGEITLSLDKIAKLKEELAVLSKEREQEGHAIGMLKHELEDLDRQAQIAQAKLDVVDRQLINASEVLADRKKSIEELDKSIANKQEEFRKLNDEYGLRKKDYDNKIESLVVKIGSLNQEEEAVKGKIAMANGQLNDLSRDKTKLESDIAVLKEEKFKLSIETEDYRAKLESDFKKKYEELEFTRKTINEREFNAKLMSDGLSDRKTHLDAYRQKLLRLVGALMIDTGINDQTKAVLKDIESKL